MQKAEEDDASVLALSKVMWCCCHWGLDPRKLFLQMDKATATDFELATPRDITAIAWTFAMLSYVDQRVLQILLEDVCRRLPIAGMCWHVIQCAGTGNALQRRF